MEYLFVLIEYRKYVRNQGKFELEIPAGFRRFRAAS
jgi:hypothetical protein